MRYPWLALLAWLVCSPMTNAQQPAPPAAVPLDPARNKVDEILINWEKAMTGVHSLLAFCDRTAVDKVYQNIEVYEGMAKFVKSTQPGQASRASLEMKKKGRPDIFEKYIYTGDTLYEYAPQSKIIRIHELPPPKPGQLADDNFLSFLFGMKAVEAKKRYNLSYVPPPANHEAWYRYVKILPIETADKADFTEARLILTAKDFMPRQLWFRQPNGNEVTWDFPKVINNADIRPTELTAPTLPASDWRFVRVPRETPARVIRQNQ